MAVQLTSRALILGKTETTQGTDAAPTPSANALLPVAFTPRLNSNDIVRSIIKAHNSPLGTVVGITNWEFDLDVEWRGINVVPDSSTNLLREDPLLRMASWSPTYSAGTNVVYTPKSAWGGAVNSATLWIYLGQLLVKMTGCMANLKIAAKVGEFPRLTFQVKAPLGTITNPAGGSDAITDVDITSVTPTYQAQSVAPAPVLSATFTMQGFGGIISDFGFDQQAVVNRRLSQAAAFGIHSFFHADRTPICNFNPEFPTRTEHDVFGLWRSGTKGALVWRVGTTLAGGGTGRVSFNAPAIQYRAPSLAEREGLRIDEQTATCTANSSGGDDEASLTWD